MRSPPTHLLMDTQASLKPQVLVWGFTCVFGSLSWTDPLDLCGCFGPILQPHLLLLLTRHTEWTLDQIQTLPCLGLLAVCTVFWELQVSACSWGHGLCWGHLSSQLVCPWEQQALAVPWHFSWSRTWIFLLQSIHWVFGFHGYKLTGC